MQVLYYAIVMCHSIISTEVEADVMMEYRELLAVDDEAAQWDKEFPDQSG